MFSIMIHSIHFFMRNYTSSYGDKKWIGHTSKYLVTEAINKFTTWIASVTWIPKPRIMIGRPMGWMDRYFYFRQHLLMIYGWWLLCLSSGGQCERAALADDLYVPTGCCCVWVLSPSGSCCFYRSRCWELHDGLGPLVFSKLEKLAWLLGLMNTHVLLLLACSLSTMV